MTVQNFVNIIWRPIIAILFVLLLSFSQAVQALEVPPEQYPFPTKDPYLATVLSSFSPSEAKYEYWKMVYRPERLKKKYPLQEPVINLQVYKQAKEAPLALIIAGVGGHSQSTNSSALGDIYIKAGYHVITLPSNLSWSYAMAISESAAPGYMPRDSVEYYQFIKWILDHAKTKKKMRYSSIALIGYSNGGLMASFLAPIDLKQSSPLFKKVLLINPAVDVIYGIKKLDYLNDVVGSTISQNWKNYIMGAIYTHAGDVAKAKDPVKALFTLLEEKKIKSHHIQWLIGDQYRQSLAEIILFSHFVINRGILKTPYSKYYLNAITEEAATISFVDYMNKVVIPTLPAEELIKDITFETSMYSQMEALRRDPRVFVFTNTDDFILKTEDIQMLRENLGPRLFLFPYGGHMGNIMVPFNVQLYLKMSQ